FGYTESSDLPVTPGAYQSTRGGSADVYAAQFTTAGTRVRATYYGGTSADMIGAGVIDSIGNIYMTGSTQSAGVMASPGTFQTAHSGNWDIFLAKFDSTLNRVWGSYYGGTDLDLGNDIYWKQNSVYIVGNTKSSGMATPGAY